MKNEFFNTGPPAPDRLDHVHQVSENRFYDSANKGYGTPDKKPNVQQQIPASKRERERGKKELLQFQKFLNRIRRKESKGTSASRKDSRHRDITHS